MFFFVCNDCFENTNKKIVKKYFFIIIKMVMRTFINLVYNGSKLIGSNKSDTKTSTTIF